MFAQRANAVQSGTPAFRCGLNAAGGLSGCCYRKLARLVAGLDDLVSFAPGHRRVSPARRGAQRTFLLIAAGIALRVDERYPLQHDKLIVADGETVETGSFKFSSAAERYNSENAVVIRHDPAFAAAFQRPWQSRWNDSTPYSSGN